MFRTREQIVTTVLMFSESLLPLLASHAEGFRDALLTVLAEHGIEQRPFSPDGPVVRSVDTEKVRTEFYKRYPADGDTEEKRQQARRKAYTRSVDGAQQQQLIGVAVTGKTTNIWCAKAGSKGNTGRDGQYNPLCSALSVPVSEVPVDTSETGVPHCPVSPVPRVSTGPGGDQ